MKGIIVLILISLLLVGCNLDEQVVQSQELKTNELAEEVRRLEVEKIELLSDAQDIRMEKGLEKYVITLNISQSHFTLDVGKHIKNAMNDIEIQLPVDKEFYESVEVGDLLDNSFRVGSLLMEGSWGKWKVKVIEKEIM